jgi:hypothetical protein
MSKKTKSIWFKKVRGSYLPINNYGVLSYIPFLGLAIYAIFWAVNSKEAIIQRFITLFSFYVALGVFMTWFASNRSK